MPLLLAIAVVVAVVWGIWLTPRVVLPAMCTAYLLSASVIGYDIWNFDAGISMSVDRIVLLLMVGCFVMHWWLKKTESRDIPTSEWILFGFMVLLLINTLMHDWRRSNPDQVPILQHMIEGYVIPFLLYWIGCRSPLNEKVVDYVYLLFGVLGIYLSLTALFEIAGMWSFVFPRKIADPTVGIHFGRARGPYLQSVRLGIYLLASFFMIWIGLVWRVRWGRTGQLLGLALSPLFLAAILATMTRSVWLGFGIAAAILFVLTLRGKFRRAALLSMVGGAVLVLLIGRSGLVAFKREANSQDTAQSTNMRVVFAYVSYLMVKEKPLRGFGFGHFPHEKEQFLTDRSTKLQMETIRGFIHHNTFLSILVELGLFGLIALCGLFVAWGRRAYRLWQDAEAPDWMRGHALVFLMFLGAYSLQMVFHEVSYSAIENGVLFLMAGMMSGMASMRIHSPSLASQASRESRPEQAARVILPLVRM